MRADQKELLIKWNQDNPNRIEYHVSRFRVEIRNLNDSSFNQVRHNFQNIMNCKKNKVNYTFVFNNIT